MGLNSVDSGTNGCNCGCENCQKTNITPVELVRTVSGVRRNVIYYDPELFCESILISPSLLIGIDEPIWDTHYNIAHDETTSGSGELDAPLEDITVAIHPKPKDTQIEGQKRMLVNSTHTYSIGTEEPYDVGNYFTYDWSLEGTAYFEGGSTSGQYLFDVGKEVSITFPTPQTITISVTITNTCGCSRVVTRDVYPGTLTRNLLVVRYPYF
jgi:hypothetical protein